MSYGDMPIGMHQPHKSLYEGAGQYAYDWQERVNLQRLRRERLEKTQEAMKENGIEVLLVMNSDNVRYTTSTITPPWMKAVPGWRYALVTQDGPPTLWEHGDISHVTKEYAPWLDGNVKRAITWIRNQPGKMMDATAEKFAKGIKEEMKERGVEKETLAIDAKEPAARNALENEGIDLTDGQKMMVDTRYVKTEDEIECLRITASICEKIFTEFQEALKPGVRENELYGLCHKIGWESGMEDITGFTICSGPNTWPNYKFFTDRRIRPGDLVTLDIGGAKWNGYNSCYYRTFVVGQPSEEQIDAYEKTKQYMESALKKVKPGNTTADLVEDWPDASEQWGYEDEFEAIANEWGHGLGLSLYEPPTVSRAFSLDFPVELKENVTFALETQEGSREHGGARIEEMVRVTSSGCEILSKYPVDELIRAW